MSGHADRVAPLALTGVARVLAGLVTVYRYTLSAVTPGHCRFQPTCSAYALEALGRHGPFHGTRLAIWRILRCNPWGPFGDDPVPPAPRGEQKNQTDGQQDRKHPS